MALSEEETRLLEQMERALVEEDPKFASTLRGTSLRSVARRRAILAGVVFVIGVAVMMTGVVMKIIPVGIVGFLIMLASATLGLSVMRGQHGAPPAAADEAEPAGGHGFTVIQGGKKHHTRSQRSRTSGSFLERMEERWRRRREGGGF